MTAERLQGLLKLDCRCLRISRVRLQVLKLKAVSGKRSWLNGMRISTI